MNRQYFSDRQVKAGELDAFLKALRASDYSDKSDTYNDIHVRPSDCGSYIVEWSQLRWDGEGDGGFQYIDFEHVVMLERSLPDDTIERFFDEDDYKRRLDEWLNEEKEAGRIWKQGQYGGWYEEGEQKAWKDYLARSSKSAEKED